MAGMRKGRNPIKPWLPPKHPGNKPGSSPKTPAGPHAPRKNEGGAKKE